MNFRSLLLICLLVALTLPTANCHSVSRRKGSPFFHLLFPNRRRPRKPKKIRLRKPPPQYYINFENGYLEPPPHPPRPVIKPESIRLDPIYPDNPYNGPNHIPQNNYILDHLPPELSEADVHKNPHGEGHLDLKGFGPPKGETYNNQNNFYKEPANHISPASPPISKPSPLPHKIPTHPSFSSYSIPHHSGPHPPPPERGQNHIPEIKYKGNLRIIKVPPTSLNEILTKPKPTKFPKKEKTKNKKVPMFNLRGQKKRRKHITAIVKETLYYGQYPKNNNAANKKRVNQPKLLPAGVKGIKGLDPKTLDFIRERVKEYSRNRG